MQSNAADLAQEIKWLIEVIESRFKLYWEQESPYRSVFEIEPPDLVHRESVYAQVVNYYQMGFRERLILILALAPHVQPHALDLFFIKNSAYDRGFTEFGGVKGLNHSGFLPTGETVAFILSANDLEARFSLLQYFNDGHYFRKHNILKPMIAQPEEPLLSGVLQMTPEYVHYFTLGDQRKPDFNMHFPAKLITTALDFEDLVVDDQNYRDLTEIRDWIMYGDKLMKEWGMQKLLKNGYRSLFYGPPGTGKTLSACLLGKITGHDVYRIDLSMIVSKYIGETEKNLANVFDQAEHKNWILFFDEADALFGKRTQTSSSNDRYANQEVSYLLQRIEDFPGVVILCTNLKANIDEAFSRRFQSMVYFALPDAEKRLRLWEQSFPKNIRFEPSVNFQKIAEQYELAGGAIVNISRYACLKAVAKDSTMIMERDIMDGIRREFAKDGKVVS